MAKKMFKEFFVDFLVVCKKNDYIDLAVIIKIVGLTK